MGQVMQWTEKGRVGGSIKATFRARPRGRPLRIEQEEEELPNNRS